MAPDGPAPRLNGPAPRPDGPAPPWKLDLRDLSSQGRPAL